MGMVDAKNRVQFYDGALRVVAPDGGEMARFDPCQYQSHIEERSVPWSYMKFTHLKAVGWQGLADGPQSGIYSVAPLARLNASSGMATPQAQEAYLELFETLGGKPVHHTLANHWARVIEMIYAAERMAELAADPAIVDPDVRAIPTEKPREGVGVVEAPRGTLFHHYHADERGIVTKANLLVATQNNAARMSLSVDKAARGLVTADTVDDGVLNMVEMAFRAYDPCLGCATHSLPGSMPLEVRVRDGQGKVVATLRRNHDGSVQRA
jgi:F420-non-reducing hydrogenase large subunit